MVTRLLQLILKMISFPVAGGWASNPRNTGEKVVVICLWHGFLAQYRVGDGMPIPHPIAMVMVVC